MIRNEQEYQAALARMEQDRQVAAHDATERSHAGLGDYYSQRGESPGRWAGAGLSGLGGPEPGQPVTEEQMTALFGEGGGTVHQYHTSSHGISLANLLTHCIFRGG
jgi:hypothetical protein